MDNKKLIDDWCDSISQIPTGITKEEFNSMVEQAGKALQEGTVRFFF